jgi:hypothetical protein
VSQRGAAGVPRGVRACGFACCFTLDIQRVTLCSHWLLSAFPSTQHAFATPPSSRSRLCRVLMPCLAVCVARALSLFPAAFPPRALRRRA